MYPSVSDLSMTQEGRNVSLTWTLPQAENLLGVRIDKNGSKLINLDVPATSYTARHIDKNIDIYFTVKARYADGSVSEGQTVMARQIAGAVARRIVTYAEAGEDCYIDEHMGFIKFGSRVDVYLPLGTEVLVKMGQSTTGNETVIAKLK